MASPAPQIRREFSKWLSLSNYDTVDVVAATLLANRLPGKAVWLALVGPPATGKTEIAQALSGCENVHLIDGITPATFVSGYKGSKRDRGHHGLLDRMRDGKPHLVVVKDFSTVLQRRLDMRGEILSRLRDLYDGRVHVPFGNDLTVDWQGKLGMIVCSTGQYDKEIKSLATFGDRFMVFRPKGGVRASVAERAGRNAGKTDAMQKALEKAYSSLDNVKVPKKDLELRLEARQMIAGLADFVTRVRSQVPRDPYRHELIDLPELEGPARVSVQLNQLAKGSMVYFGREEVTNEDLELLESLVFSTVPEARAKVLNAIDLRSGTSGREVARQLNITQAVVRRVIEDLMLLEVVTWEGDSERSATGSWTVVKQWKPFVFRMKQWMEGRQ